MGPMTNQFSRFTVLPYNGMQGTVKPPKSADPILLTVQDIVGLLYPPYPLVNVCLPFQRREAR